MCQTEVENEVHFLLKCKWVGYRDARRTFISNISSLVHNFDLLSADDQSLFLMVQENKVVTESLVQ